MLIETQGNNRTTNENIIWLICRLIRDYAINLPVVGLIMAWTANWLRVTIAQDSLSRVTAFIYRFVS